MKILETRFCLILIMIIISFSFCKEIQRKFKNKI